VLSTLNRNSKKLAVAVSLLALNCAGCLVPEESTASVEEQIAAAGMVTLTFGGATSAYNLDGTRIRLGWSAASGTFQYYKVYELQADGSLVTIATLPKSLTAYTIVGLTAGTLHSYVVRAVTSDGESDGNSSIVSAATYAGITSVSAISTTSATINYPAGNSAFSMTLYCSLRGGDYEVMATVVPTSTSQSLTGLQSGSTYTCKVFALSQLGFEDTNTATKTFQTIPANYTGYQGPILASAYGAATGAPAGTPQAKQVRITWKAFGNATATTSYKLLRVSRSGTLDPMATTACTSSTATSCIVTCPATAASGVVVGYDSANLTGLGAKTCTDSKVAAPPAQYDYYVMMVGSSGVVEELPWTTPTSGTSETMDAYRITVPIPPNNMVLVQRDSANYEMCNLMEKTSDPLNHQRCAYSGQGAVPYNIRQGASALSFDSGYYDFGYNLFVDRFQVGCNWTPSANGGKCGAGATSGDCYGTTAPAATIGVDGNVYYNTADAYCWVKTDTTWTRYGTYNYIISAIAESYRNMAMTNAADQTYRKPPLGYLSQQAAGVSCESIIDPNYGSKRLMRRREQVVAAAWPSITGEPGAMTDTQIGTVEAGGAGNCNSDNAHGFSPVAFNTSDESAVSTSAGGRVIVIGSTKTVNCTSRYGAQDMVGNAYQWVSDQIGVCDTTAHTCAALSASTIDSGNIDTANINYTGTSPGGSNSNGPGGGASNIDLYTISSGTYNASYFSLPLGIPLVGTDGGNATPVASLGTTKLHGDLFNLNTDYSASSPRSAMTAGGYNTATSNGRFLLSYVFVQGATAFSQSYTFRCSLPASDL
jgi:hypothetical protein